MTQRNVRQIYCDVFTVLRDAERYNEAVSLLRAWVAGCGDEHFSTKEQCRELLQRSGEFLASLEPQPGDGEPGR